MTQGLGPTSKVQGPTSQACAPGGIDEYWLVDPDRQCLTVYTLSAGTYDAGHTFTTGRVRSSVLPGLAVSVEDVCAAA